jgi:hypothetical protein
MNTRHILAAAALALTGATASASPSVFNDMPSTMSRAEVLAQVDQQRAEGRTLRANDTYGAAEASSTVATAGVTTREEVLSELVAARASGEFDARGEVYGSFTWTQFGNVEQELPEQASVAAARIEAENAAALAAATPSAADASIMTSYEQNQPVSYESSTDGEPVVLWVPLDGEAITLQPGEAVLLVPGEQQIAAPDAE